MLLNVITAVTRPENLPKLAESLATGHPWDIAWHLRFDPEHANVGGQNLKNDALNDITDGWVWILDDDTIAAPGLLQAVADTIDATVEAVIVSMWHAQQGRTLVAAPYNMIVGSVDAGQAFFRRDAIGGSRLADHYDGDGMFIAEVLETLDGEIAYLEVEAIHNALR